MARSPGDLSPIVRNGSGHIILTFKGSVFSSSSQTNREYEDYRPGYPKGSRTKIGTKYWIYPTAYYHGSRQVTAPGEAYAETLVGASRYQNQESNPQIYAHITNMGFPLSLSRTSVLYSNERNASQVKALNSLADQKAGIGEDLATFRQTLGLFTSKTSLLVDLLNAFKRDRLLKSFKNLSRSDLLRAGNKKAAQAYLEYVYGWKPLVSDIYGVHQLLKEYASGARPIILHGHGTTRFTDFSKETKTTTPGTFGSWMTRNTKISVRTTCDLYAQVEPAYAGLRAVNQLGLLNPASLLWDITPWSFVVDWLIPIGPVLQALTARTGLNFISGSVGEKVSRFHEGDYHTVGSPTGTQIADNPIHYTVKDEFYTRLALTGWPTPLPYIDLNPLRGDRPLKALALRIANLKR